MIIKGSVLIFIFMLGIVSLSFAEECVITVKDFIGKPVAFCLNSNEKQFKSNDKGELKINNSDFQRYKNVRFALEFQDKLAGFIYENQLEPKNIKDCKLPDEKTYSFKSLCECKEFIVPDLKRGTK
jgi:hypothetical protein